MRRNPPSLHSTGAYFGKIKGVAYFIALAGYDARSLLNQKYRCQRASNPPYGTAQLAHTLAHHVDKLSTEMLEFIETVLVYKLPNLNREEIRAMLGLDGV